MKHFFVCSIVTALCFGLPGLGDAPVALAQSGPARALSAPHGHVRALGARSRQAAARVARSTGVASRPTRRSRRDRRLRLSIALAAAVGAGLSVAVADVSARRRGGACAETQPDGECARARRATGLGSFAATSLLVTPFALWLAGHVQGGRGGYVIPLLTTGVGLMLAGLTVAMTQGLARSMWGRRVGYDIAALLPATFGALGYLARDAERRRFGGAVSLTPRRGGAEVGYVRRF